MDKLRLRQSVGIVIKEGVTEFFKSNTRESIKIKINFPHILELLQSFDGATSLRTISEKHGLSNNIDQLKKLSYFLLSKNILINQDKTYPQKTIDKSYRLINILEDYCQNTSEVINSISKINSAKVMIIGAGAVGSNIAATLSHSGVSNLIIVDHDDVDISNLHRQYFFEENIGDKKIAALSKKLKKINPKMKLEAIYDMVDDGFFERNILSKDLDLIINCSDEPSVDYTSKIISHYCMKNLIPHIVGGGYNLHQTLIGQTIIPFETACFKCFSNHLDKINQSDLINVKKLYRKQRKLGAYSPLSGIASSLASLDALKIISGHKKHIQQANTRVEFSIKELTFKSTKIPRDPKCEWCAP